MEKTVIHNGVTCMLSEAAVASLGNDETIANMLENFFENEKVEDIKWVELEDVMLSEDECLPMYTMSNDAVSMAFWPIKIDEKLLLGVELVSESLAEELELPF